MTLPIQEPVWPAHITLFITNALFYWLHLLYYFSILTDSLQNNSVCKPTLDWTFIQNYLSIVASVQSGTHNEQYEHNQIFNVLSSYSPKYLNI